MPATSRTICIGSAYWRANCCQRDAFLASAKVFGPYFARRASASAVVRPVVGVDARAGCAASSGVERVPGGRPCRGVVAAAGWLGPVGRGHDFFPFLRLLGGLRPASAQLGLDRIRRGAVGRLGLELDLGRLERIACASVETFGNCGSISIRVWARTPAAATRANGLSSAGMTYHGAHSRARVARARR